MPATDPPPADRIAGLSILKGLVVYGATLTFAGFYAYFMQQIASTASGAKPPTFSGTMVGAAAALAGVLGSAFAITIGVPTTAVNQGLADDIAGNPWKPKTVVRRILSLEPGGKDTASIPLTFGIWAYAIVGTAVAIVYFLKPAETPGTVKALAVAFAGYVVAFMTAAYGIATKSSGS